MLRTISNLAQAVATSDLDERSRTEFFERVKTIIVQTSDLYVIFARQFDNSDELVRLIRAVIDGLAEPKS